MSQLNIPHSIEAEQAVLGGLLLDNTKYDDIVEIIEANDFYNHDHRIVFQAISSLHQDNKPFDVITISEKLAALKANSKDTLVYVAELARNTPSIANINTYAEIIKERSTLRVLCNIGHEISQKAISKDITSISVIELADQQLFELTQKQQRVKGFTNLNEVLNQVVNKIDTNFNSGNPITGVPTGLKDLDIQTSGLQN